jgi:hypothetical protein
MNFLLLFLPYHLYFFICQILFFYSSQLVPNLKFCSIHSAPDLLEDTTNSYLSNKKIKKFKNKVLKTEISPYCASSLSCFHTEPVILLELLLVHCSGKICNLLQCTVFRNHSNLMWLPRPFWFILTSLISSLATHSPSHSKLLGSLGIFYF